MDLGAVCGQLVRGGWWGTELPDEFLRAVAAGTRGGAVIFRRNVTDNLAELSLLNASIARAAPADLPPLIAVDQEGGRVARIGAPLLVTPPMLAVAARGQELVERVARVHATELRALGFTMNLAPVLDVHSNPKNPIIGDRAFGE